MPLLWTGLGASRRMLFGRDVHNGGEYTSMCMLHVTFPNPNSNVQAALGRNLAISIHVYVVWKAEFYTC